MAEVRGATVRTCLVTLHGVGEATAPGADGSPGYADSLHQSLAHHLPPEAFGDDLAPIYVQGNWPLDSLAGRRELARLGAWDDRQPLTINPAGAPLGTSRSALAHVALLYPRLPSDDAGPHLGALLEACAMMASSYEHYVSIRTLARMSVEDLRLALSHANGRVESESEGVLDHMRHLQDEVAAYVCRNDLRERVRDFVREALLRICCRDDVGRLVVNAHSQGSVIAFDALRHLPAFAARKITWFVTTGSPLRKYTALLAWGGDAGNIRAVGAWTNFWDPNDVVSDPLAPSTAWRRGMPLDTPLADSSALFSAIDPDTGSRALIRIEDRQVDNCTASLDAHDYWDNESQFIAPLAEILLCGVEGTPASAVPPGSWRPVY